MTFVFDKQPNKKAMILGRLFSLLINLSVIYLIFFLRINLSFPLLLFAVILFLVFFIYRITDLKRGFISGQQMFGNIINFILLFVTYFIGIGPIWLISRLTKRKFLNMNFKHTKSYWRESHLGRDPKEKYYHQF